MFTGQLAKIILVPYLWLGGYEMNDESIAECYDSIEIYCRNEEEPAYAYYISFVSTPD
ncbi:MAG: hypothetical protein ISR34_08195 [Pirellulales bacterium]|nr:hypothetical protein [Pirellulales bacterium]